MESTIFGVGPSTDQCIGQVLLHRGWVNFLAQGDVCCSLVRPHEGLEVVGRTVRLRQGPLQELAIRERRESRGWSHAGKGLSWDMTEASAAILLDTMSFL